MDKTAIKNFAIWARVKLMTDISTRLGFLGITEKGIAEPLTASTSEIQYFDIGAVQPVSVKGVAIRQRSEIVEKIRRDATEEDLAKAYHNFVETMAFDWFNRLVAIRYMEINEYAPLDVRLLSSVEEGRQDPDLVSTPFDGSLSYTENEEQRIQEWKSNHDNSKLFRFLLFKMCNKLHDILPGIFESDNDYSELLLRQSFIDKDGVIYHLVHDIPEEDWKDQVQIIGWIYQYYNTELKVETFKLLDENIKVSKDRIPSATQLFTPDWIVRYMVENSLGRLWINHLKALNSEADEKEIAEKFGWQYYIPEAKQDSEVEAKLVTICKDYENLQPEDLSCLDPCMGSGHILSYMFDVLEQIYTSVGYTERDAAKSILEHNIFGLDIDDRAYQLAYFSVMMKARQYNRRILSTGISPHVYAIEESNGINKEQLTSLGEHMSDSERSIALQQAEKLVDLFHDAKIYGSILQIPEMDWDLLRRLTMNEDENGQSNLNWNVEIQNKLKTFINLGEALSKKYWVTITNPPYMGIGNMDPKLYNYVILNYQDFKQDLYCTFIKACAEFTRREGLFSMVSQQSFMFNSRFGSLREYILNNLSFVNMMYLGTHAFEDLNGEKVRTCTYVCRNVVEINQIAIYIDLQQFGSGNMKENASLNIISRLPDGTNENVFYAPLYQYENLQGKTFSYWISPRIINIMNEPVHLSKYAETRHGLVTGNGDMFMRLWTECNINNIGILKNSCNLKLKWFPYNKGGGFRRWYGNREYVVNWQNNGNEIRNFKVNGLIKSSNYNLDYNFKENISWSDIKSGYISARFTPSGALFDTSGPSLFVKNQEDRFWIIGLLNSKAAQKILNVSCTGLHYSTGAVSGIPIPKSLIDYSKDKINELVAQAIKICKEDWDSFELSWDYRYSPLISDRKKTIDEQYKEWEDLCNKRKESLRKIEDEINSIFIDIYDLQNDFKFNEEKSDLSVHNADLKQDIKALISYAIGCMCGRYSLDEEGLTYAGGNWDPSRYHKFLPDADNVIPITDQKYLPDDVVERICEFLTVVYGKETLEENLDFIAKALDVKGVTSRDIIRSYMITVFFKDHCNTYSVTGSGKRPIYWLFDSGKQNAFKALVYMHRWDADTTGRVLIYAQKIQQKYETELRAIETMLDHMTDPKEQAREERRQEHLRKQLAELVDYEERLEHMANERITIDLDDGVKVNYEKVQTDRNGKKFQILAPIK